MSLGHAAMSCANRASILLTATTPMAFLGMNYPTVAAIAAKLPGRLPAIFLPRPTPFVLFAMGCFYLWVYWRHEPERDELAVDAGTVAARQPVSEPAR